MEYNPFDRRMRVPLRTNIPTVASCIALLAALLSVTNYLYNGLSHAFTFGLTDSIHILATYWAQLLGGGGFHAVYSLLITLVGMLSIETVAAVVFILCSRYSRIESRIMLLPSGMYLLLHIVRFALYYDQFESTAWFMLAAYAVAYLVFALTVLGVFPSKLPSLIVNGCVVLLSAIFMLFNHGLFFLRTYYNGRPAFGFVYIGLAVGSILFFIANMVWTLALSDNWTNAFFDASRKVVVDKDGVEIVLDRGAADRRKRSEDRRKARMKDFDPDDDTFVTYQEVAFDPNRCVDAPAESHVIIEPHHAPEDDAPSEDDPDDTPTDL